jgi:hypothetical protein
VRLRTRLYLATVGRLRLASRERELIKRGFWQEAAKAIYARVGQSRCIAILCDELGMTEKEAKRSLRQALLEDESAT